MTYKIETIDNFIIQFKILSDVCLFNIEASQRLFNKIQLQNYLQSESTKITHFITILKKEDITHKQESLLLSLTYSTTTASSLNSSKLLSKSSTLRLSQLSKVFSQKFNKTQILPILRYLVLPSYPPFDTTDSFQLNQVCYRKAL